MFRPCIDLHQGKVKQIVGGSLSDQNQDSSAHENFISEKPANWYAELYKRDQLKGGHVIKLGPGNEDAASEALQAFPGGLQLGGGVTSQNATHYLDLGASHVIVTSYIFDGPNLSRDKLKHLKNIVGSNRLVIDLSCRKRDDDYFVVTDRWQTFTDAKLSPSLFDELSDSCDEFLVHGVDVEGLCQGIDLELVELIRDQCPKHVTYAGGAKSISDLENVTRIGNGKIHLTIGSALDIFGGSGVKYQEAIQFR